MSGGLADDWVWPLPATPYVPGQTARPDDDDDVHRIARAAPDPTDPERWADNVAWLAGLRLYRESYYWEAHEVWEPVWMHAMPNSRERLLTQGVIQIANAALKQRMGRPKASLRLATIARQLLADASDVSKLYMGIDVARLERDLAIYQGRLIASPDAAIAPRISLAGFD